MGMFEDDKKVGSGEREERAGAMFGQRSTRDIVMCSALDCYKKEGLEKYPRLSLKFGGDASDWILLCSRCEKERRRLEAKFYYDGASEEDVNAWLTLVSFDKDLRVAKQARRFLFDRYESVDLFITQVEKVVRTRSEN